MFGTVGLYFIYLRNFRGTEILQMLDYLQESKNKTLRYMVKQYTRKSGNEKNQREQRRYQLNKCQNKFCQLECRIRRKGEFMNQDALI